MWVSMCCFTWEREDRNVILRISKLLLHRILQLVRVVALGAGPGCLALSLVEVGDEQHPDLPLQLLVVRSRLARSARLLHHRLAHLVELHLVSEIQ